MKGIAILGIMLHNYCHWLQGIVRENEYTWLQWKTDRLWEVLQNPDELLPLHLLSFFGHYGVPVFLFLSGYGLVKKYEFSGASSLPVWRFIRYNYLKLFRIFIVGFVLFTMLDAFTPGMHRYQWDEVIAMLGMYANVYEHPATVIWPGPYWYFSITLQLYILYRLLMFRWRHWGIVVALIAGCWLWQVAFLGDAEALERLRYNFIGGMLPFGLGVLAARGEKAMRFLNDGAPLTAYGLSLIVSIALVVALSFSAQAWLWVPVFIVTGTIALVKLLPRWVLPYIVWTGGISAAMFVSHPLVRKIFVRPYIRDDLYAGLLLYVVASFVVAWLLMQVINRIPKPKL